mgnify:CR=1 FL=1
MNGVKIPKNFNLTEGEVPYWYGRPSWKYLWAEAFLGILIVLLTFVLLLVISLVINAGGLYLIALLILIPIFIPLLLASLLVILAIILSPILLFIVVLEFLTTEYLITNKRIYIKKGIISRTIQEARLEWVRAVAVNQSILERIINCGKVIISTSSELVGTIALERISNPMKVKNLIEELLAKREHHSTM